MDANDANQNMEMLRAFFSQSRATNNNNNNNFQVQHQPQQHPQQLSQQQQLPQQFQPPAQFFVDTLQGINNLSNAASSLVTYPSAAPSADMCVPSVATYSLATGSGYSLPLQPMNRPPNPQGRRRDLTEQERFLIFVKILFKCLEKSEDPRLKPRAKAVVTECTRGNRMGDTNYMPLQDAVERRLRRHVGEQHWTRAKLYYDQYLIRRGFGSSSSDSMESVRITATV